LAGSAVQIDFIRIKLLLGFSLTAAFRGAKVV
jgi:hypothetical protein